LPGLETYNKSLHLKAGWAAGGPMSDHETPDEVDGDLEKLLSSKEGVSHLIRGCGTCKAAARQGRISRAAVRAEGLTPELSAAYDVALDRVTENARRVAPLPPGQQWRFHKANSLLRAESTVFAITKRNMSVEGLGLYEALLARSWAIRYDDPRKMCHLAKVAVEMCDRFDPKVLGPKKVADLKARAWGELANACRVANQYREAQNAFGTAYGFFREGSGDPDLLIRLLDLEASLLGTLREFPLALERLRTLAGMHQEAEDAHLVGRTLITQSLYMFYRGDAKEACRTVAEGLALIDRDRDPSLVLVGAFNHLLFLVDCERYWEAKKVLFKHRPNFTKQGRIAMLKLRGIEGRISYGLGKLESAEIAIRETKEGFAEAGMGFACALEGLDLALTLLRQGRREEAFQQGLESAEMFMALGIQREILGTVLLLEETFRAEKEDLELLEASVRYLRKKMIELGVG
jgi:tetratricopeptide (TPR) repeat protein